MFWWRIRDSNPGPKDYDSSALTTELIRHAGDVLSGDSRAPVKNARIARCRAYRLEFDRALDNVFDALAGCFDEHSG